MSDAAAVVATTAVMCVQAARATCADRAHSLSLHAVPCRAHAHPQRALLFLTFKCEATQKEGDIRSCQPALLLGVNQLACPRTAPTAHSSLTHCAANVALRSLVRRRSIDRPSTTRAAPSNCTIACSAHPPDPPPLVPPSLPIPVAAMSLVGMDGKAIQFETKPQTQAPAASPFQLTNKFAFDLPNSPAAAAAAASAASVTSPAAAAAAASSTGGGLFSSQPIALPGQPGAFAPSLPQRSSEPPPSVKIDFSEFENVSDARCVLRVVAVALLQRMTRAMRRLTPLRAPRISHALRHCFNLSAGQDIADMEEAKRREFLEGLQVNAARIASETKGTAPLPSQIGDSKLFHQMVLKQYGSVTEAISHTAICACCV